MWGTVAGVRGDESYRLPPAAEWAQPGGHWGNSRFSTLKQITARNAASLGGAWVAHLDGEQAQAAPLVQNGLMFVPTSAQNLYALNPATGAVVWKYQTDLPPSAGAGLARTRGVALGEGRVFLPQADTRVLALDQKTGKVLWSRKIGDEKPDAPQTLAWPGIYASGLYITGLQLGDIGIRGRVTALDARTGEEKWRFYIVPAPGEAGSETWPANSDAWRKGGGALWMNPAVDADLGLVYFNTGNPWPTWTAEIREGDNLYTASIVALDLKTGAYRWHFQLTHHDIWDMDAPNGVMLFDPVIGGRTRKGIAAFGTHGYLFMFDRQTGKPLYKIEERPVPQDPTVKTARTQPYPVGADPVLPQCVDPAQILPGFHARCFFDIYTDAPNVVQPFMGVRQAPSSYNPGTGYFYTVANIRPSWLSRYQNGGGFSSPPGMKDHGVLVALNAKTQKIAWQQRLPYPVAMGGGPR